MNESGCVFVTLGWYVVWISVCRLRVVTFFSTSSNSVSIVSLLIVHYHIASCLLAFLRFLGRRYTVIPRSPHCRYLPHARENSTLRQTSRGLSGIRSLPYTIFSTHTQHHGLSRTLVVLLSWEEYFPPTWTSLLSSAMSYLARTKRAQETPFLTL
jgi:hypothetical protein